MFHLNLRDTMRMYVSSHLVLHHVCFCSVCFDVFVRSDFLFLCTDDRIMTTITLMKHIKLNNNNKIIKSRVNVRICLSHISPQNKKNHFA